MESWKSSDDAVTAAAWPSGVRPVPPASPLPGPSGNVEYFLLLRSTAAQRLSADERQAAVRRAIAEGPQ